MSFYQRIQRYGHTFCQWLRRQAFENAEIERQQTTDFRYLALDIYKNEAQPSATDQTPWEQVYFVQNADGTIHTENSDENLVLIDIDYQRVPQELTLKQRINHWSTLTFQSLTWPGHHHIQYHARLQKGQCRALAALWLQPKQDQSLPAL